MNLEKIKEILPNLDELHFQFEDQSFVPAHFHITEVGLITKKFIDCGGVLREDNFIGFQLFTSYDIEHKLKPQKLLNIINLAQRKLDLPNCDIQVEFQGKSIEIYSLDFNGKNFVLTSKNTACLASDACGIPVLEAKELEQKTVCTPGGGCC